MSNRSKYYDLQDELQALEEKTGLYLADESVDHENCEPIIQEQGIELGSDEWYGRMIRAAEMAAGMRAEEAGQDINALIGRVIY